MFEDPKHQNYLLKDYVEAIGKDNTRSMLRASRGILAQTVKKKIRDLSPLISRQDGIALFGTYSDGHRSDTLVIESQKFNNRNNVIIITNYVRDSVKGEPNFPNGTTMEVYDLAIPCHSSKWLNSSWNKLYIDSSDDDWEIPERSTLIQQGHDSVRLYGNYAECSSFYPEPARDLYDIEQDATVLWGTYNTLRHCNEVALEQYVTRIEY